MSEEGFDNIYGQWMMVPPETSFRWNDAAPNQWKYYGAYHFLPVYPIFLRLLLLLPVHHDITVFVASHILFALFVIALYKLGQTYGDGVGHDTVRLACLWPPVIFSFGAFSETLYTATAAWALLSISQNHRIRGGFLAALAAGLRIPGLAVPAALAWHYLAKRRDIGLKSAFISLATTLIPAGCVVLAVAWYFYSISGELFPFVRAQELGGHGIRPPWEVLRTDLHHAVGGILILPYWSVLIILSICSFFVLRSPLFFYCLLLVGLYSLDYHSGLIRYSATLFPLLIVVALIAKQEKPLRSQFVTVGLSLFTAVCGALSINHFFAL
jgi:hypothetical protein